MDQEDTGIQIFKYLTLDGVRPLGPTALGTPNQLHLEGSQPCLGSIFIETGWGGYGKTLGSFPSPPEK